MKLYLEDYYLGKINNMDLCELKGIKEYDRVKYFRSQGLLTFSNWLGKLNFTNKDLRKALRMKYNSIKNRCNGEGQDKYGHYNGLPYINVMQWVDFCNQHEQLLNNMWEKYVNSERNLKYAISIDRVDDSLGYIAGNMEFVTHGFNSWKSTLNRPVTVLYKNETYLFMSCNEASRFFALREQTIGEYYRGERRDGIFIVSDSSVSDVLSYSNCKDIKDYYTKFIQ